MGKRSAFILPDGLEMEITDDTISIRYEGDLQLDTTLGRSIGELHADGDIALNLPHVGGTVSAGGVLTIEGDVDAEVLHGREVTLGGGTIKATAISATERITIGAAKLKVDCIIAPEIHLDPKASGRVTVIESRNERGATKIKGGFSLADYDDMLGSAAEFLAERGLEPLGDGPAPAPAKKGKKAAAPPSPEDEEDVDDPLSLSIDDIEEIVEEAKGGGDKGSLFSDLGEAVARISSCYEEGDLPPAVSELQLLVEQGDIDALRDNITEVWNGLLSYHHKRGIRPHHQVTHAFNQIHGLIQ